MSRLAVCLIAFTMLLLGSSCVPSIHGIATVANNIPLDGLVGSWVDDQGSSSWVFSENDTADGYVMMVDTPDEDPAMFYVAVVELEGELFLDLFPSNTDPHWPLNSFYGLHFSPMHTFMHITLADGELSMAMMDPGWLEKWLPAHPDAVSYEKENYIILTGSTAQLQALLPRILKEPAIADAGFMGEEASAFTEPVVLHQGELPEKSPDETVGGWMIDDGASEATAEPMQPTEIPQAP